MVEAKQGNDESLEIVAVANRIRGELRACRTMLALLKDEHVARIKPLMDTINHLWDNPQENDVDIIKPHASRMIELLLDVRGEVITKSENYKTNNMEEKNGREID